MTPWVVSPFHAATQHAAAMASFLLADSCVLLLPRPDGEATRDAFVRAGERIPGFREAVETLAWTTPLWDRDILRAEHEGRSVRAAVAAALALVGEDPSLAALRGLINAAVFDDEDAYLEAICQDLIRGGVDPGIGIPVSVGLDLFASTNGLTVVRSAPTSVVEKTEHRAAIPISSCSVPILAQATGERLIEARHALAAEITDLAGAIEAGLDPRPQAHAFSRAFELERESLLRCDDPDEPPAMQAQVTLQYLEMPGDASLRASAAAAKRYVPGGAPVATTESTSVARALPPLRTLIVKPLGRPAALR